MSAIEWTDVTWNPVTGCTKCSLGCQNCYARAIALRMQAVNQPKYKNGFEVSLHPTVLDEPMSYPRPRRIFVCSMSDIFHPDIPDWFLDEIFATIAKTPQHTYLMLTKRPERMAAFRLPRLHNLQVGVTVEHPQYMGRIDTMLKWSAGLSVRFLSIEPMLASMNDIPLDGIDWVIVGGESGLGVARPVHPSWVKSVRDQCLVAGVPFFFKQWGEWGVTTEFTAVEAYHQHFAGCLLPGQIPGNVQAMTLGKKCHFAYPNSPGPVLCLESIGRVQAGRELDGRTWDEMPTPRDHKPKQANLFEGM